MMNPSQRIAGALLAAVAFFAEPRDARGAEADPPTLRALIVGGGPDEASNAAQIESHARFVLQTLPTTCLRRVLFADGKPKNTSVTYADLRDNALARRALAVLLPDDNLDPDNLNRVPAGGLTAGTAYAASKGALTSLTFSLARELAPFGVTVNGISPAYVKTPMVTEQLTEAQRQALVAQIPVGRFCEPEEFAHVVRFLVSPMSGFITGEIVDLNGGLVMD